MRLFNYLLANNCVAGPGNKHKTSFHIFVVSESSPVAKIKLLTSCTSHNPHSKVPRNNEWDKISRKRTISPHSQTNFTDTLKRSFYEFGHKTRGRVTLKAK